MHSPVASLATHRTQRVPPTETSATRRKRRNSNHDAPAPGETRYRASRACQYCRVRKVRCDVLRSDASCTNCRLDNRDCVVLASRRGKTKRGLGGGSNVRSESPLYQSPNLRSMCNSDSNHAATYDKGFSPKLTPSQMESAAAVVADVPICVTFDENNEQVESGQQLADDGLTANYTSSEGHDVLAADSHDSIASTIQSHPSPAGTAPLPTFIAPFESRVPAEDLDFLSRKGALTVPGSEIQIEILKSYAFCVHPFMPMLDLKPFVEAVLNDRKDERISLLLFQAVMFAGLSSLDQHVVHRLGFDNAKQAREVFFNRVKLLYEFDIEPDSTAVFQSLLLMSSWYSKWNEWKDNSHWTALAFLVAQNMGLHREPTSACGSDRVQRHRRRMWWSLFIRDRMLALGTRRPMRIRDDDFDVTMLTLEDFDFEPLTKFSYGQPGALDAAEQKCTALICIELAKLCVCIGHVLSTQYTTLSTEPPASYKTIVLPRRDEKRAAELQNCDEEVDEWYKQLSPSICTIPSMSPRVSSTSCSEVHWAMLNLAHLTLVNVLHRTQALQSSPDTAEAQVLRTTSRLKVKESARKITKIAHTMLRHNQVRFLGLNGITALLAACLSHMVDIRTGDDDMRDASIFRFDQSMLVLHSMRGTYATADAAVAFLASVIRKAQLPLLSQVTMPAPYFMSASSNYFFHPLTSSNGHAGMAEVLSFRDGLGDVAQTPHKPLGAALAAQSSLSDAQSATQTHHFAFLGADRQSLGDAAPAPGHGASSIIRFDNTLFESIPTSTANEPPMKWNGSLESAMNLEPFLYSFDFFPEAFGFPAG